MRISARAQAATESPTLALTARVKALQAAGQAVIGFGAGEPDFDTPEHIKEAARRALAAGFTKYCPAAGTVSLREAIAAKHRRDQGLDYSPATIVVGCGGKHSLQGLFHALLDPGDAVILPAPYWVSYLDQTRIAGGLPVIVPCDESTGLKLTPGRLAAVLEQYPFARALVINSPSNPTGVLYDEAELRALGEVISGYPELIVISDEIYEHLIYDGARHFSLAQVPALFDQTVIVNGVSKAYSMTGWRVGWAAGPKPLISAVARLQSHDTSGPCSIAQAAAEAALNGDQSCVAEMRAAFAQRRRVMVDGLRALPGFVCAEPGGAFYAFPSVAEACRPGERSPGFAARLLETAQVAVVPGDGFGAMDNVRLSYAASLADIEEGLARMARFVAGG